jgi:hypothetical protein
MKPNINNFEFIEAGSGTMPEDDLSGAPPAAMPSPKPKKSGIVTKEELEKSGMSLRDYLNKQRGLTRRKEKDPTAGEARDKAAQAAADAIDPGADPDFSKKMGMSAYKPRRSYNEPPVGNAKRSEGNYAKGGKVSSASKRADGIATKGKTRGRFC